LVGSHSSRKETVLKIYLSLEVWYWSKWIAGSSKLESKKRSQKARECVKISLHQTVPMSNLFSDTVFVVSLSKVKRGHEWVEVRNLFINLIEGRSESMRAQERCVRVPKEA